MNKPNLKKLNIYIDGAARGNPGPAGAGIVVTDSSGNAIKNISRYVGNTTNNVAEYTALIFGMEEVHNLGAKELTINTDSELLAKQLGGEYKVKNSALRDLYTKIMQMLKSFDEVRINQIKRQENKGADKLANKAIDDAGKKRVGKSFVLKSRNQISDSLF